MSTIALGLSLTLITLALAIVVIAWVQRASLRAIARAIDLISEQIAKEIDR